MILKGVVSRGCRPIRNVFTLCFLFTLCFFSNAHALHPLFLLGGMLYKINENFSVDLGLKTGLNKAEADYAVLAGTIVDF